MGVGDVFVFQKYRSDDGTDYAIKLSSEVASAGGFTTPVSPSTIKVWPFGAKNLRHVLGKIVSTGQRTRLPIQSASNTLYTSGGSFTLTAGAYTVEGQIGEKRKYNSVS